MPDISCTYVRKTYVRYDRNDFDKIIDIKKGLWVYAVPIPTYPNKFSLKKSKMSSLFINLPLLTFIIMFIFVNL